jgi:hypothetical protein
MKSPNLVLKVISFVLFMIAITMMFLSSRLVADGDSLFIAKIIACFGIFISTINLINFWTGRPHIDLGKRVLVACGVFCLCFIGSCSNSKRKPEGQDDIKQGDSRFYMVPSGSALDFVGTSVFQERRLVDSIFTVKEICFFEKNEGNLTVKLIEPNQLECKSDKSKRTVSIVP